MGDRYLMAGTVLTGDEVRAIRPTNRSSLIDKNFIAVWPVDASQFAGPPAVRHVVPRGFGRYDVVEGRKLNDEWLDKEAAFALAGLPLPSDAENGKNAH
jgi:hypothetical protein